MSARHDGIRARRKVVRRLSHAGWSRPAIARELGCTVSQVQHDRVATRTRKRAPAKWRNPALTAKRRAAVARADRRSSRVSNRELARRWGVSTETIRADRQMMGLTASTGRAGKRRSDLVGWMLAGQSPREIANRTGRHIKTIERDIRVVLGGGGRQAFLDEMAAAGIPVGFKTK
jgi:DNA-binding CsgD family transcriptional regulator